MRRLQTFASVRAQQEDDLLLTCVSFEDRCLAIKRFDDGYRTKRSALLRFHSSKPHRALDRKRESNFLELSAYLRAHSHADINVLALARYNPFELELLLSDTLGTAIADATVITVDISCLTRIQLLFLLRGLLTTRGKTIRLVYASPVDYGSTNAKEIATGIDGMLFMPYIVAPGHEQELGADNFLVAVLGHEGPRCLAAWRTFEPNRTVLLLPDSPRTPDLTRTAERHNQQLIERASAGDSTFQLARLDPFRMRENIARASRIIDDLELRDPHAVLSLMPGGPKPLISSLAIAALQSQVSCSITYPLVSGYDPAYSVGIKALHEFVLTTPLEIGSGDFEPEQVM